MTAHQNPDFADTALWKEQDRDWAARFIYVLSFTSDLPAEKLEQAVERTRSITLETDLPAEKLFGDPDKAAKLVAHQETSHEDRSESRIMAATEAVGAALMVIGFLIFVLTWFITDYGTWRITHPYNLAFVATVGTLMALGGTLTWSAVSRGRIGAAVATGLLGLAGVGAAIFTLGPLMERTDQPTLPMFVGLLLGIALLVGGVLVAIAGGWASAQKREDTRDWFTQLEGYLRGQQAFSAKEASGVVQEARDHLASIQSARGEAITPESEFGSAAAYAQAYAGDSVKSIKRKGWLKLASYTLQFLIFMVIAWGLMRDGGWFRFVFWGLGILIYAANFVSVVKQNRRAVAERLREARDE